MKYAFFVIILCSLTACRSIKDSDFAVGEPNRFLLPALEVRYDVFSFQYLSALNFFEVPESNLDETFHADSAKFLTAMTLSQRAHDIITLFDQEVRSNIISSDERMQGYLVCKIANGKTERKLGFAVLSGLTFGIPNLFGMPIGRVNTSLELQVAIYNRDKELVKTYTAPCDGRAWIALYYGYSEKGNNMQESPVYRKANIEAFKCALAKIKHAIEEEHDKLLFLLR